MGCTIKRIDDYMDTLKERYPEMSERDLTKILKLGFSFIRKTIAIGISAKLGSKETAVEIRDDINRDKTLYKAYRDATLKSRIKWNRSGKKYDDYYYFSIGKTQYDKIKDAVEKKKEVTFSKVTLFKAPEECWLKHKYKRHFFRVLWPIECGFEIYKDKLKTDKYEYLGNEREKSRNKWIQQGSKSRSEPDITAKQLVELLS